MPSNVIRAAVRLGKQGRGHAMDCGADPALERIEARRREVLLAFEEAVLAQGRAAAGDAEGTASLAGMAARRSAGRVLAASESLLGEVRAAGRRA